jgi:succinoglycan biosynthesis protein ExoU
MTQPQTGVGVVIAAYNAQDTVARAIQSALSQADVIEVIVVNDASTDATADVARQCDDGSNRLQVVNLASNSGPAAARNIGVDRIRAVWLGVLDADDFLQEGRIAGMLALANDWDFLADEIIRVDSDAQIAPVDWGAPAQGVHHVAFEEFVQANQSNDRVVRIDLGFAKPLIRKSFLDKHALRYRAEMRLGEDYEFYARALLMGARFGLTSPKGYMSINYAGSLSNAHSIADLRKLRDCNRGLRQVRTLTRGERRALADHALSVDKRLQWRILIDAVKTRNVLQALLTFKSPRVASYLLAQLRDQAHLRFFSKTHTLRTVV